MWGIFAARFGRAVLRGGRAGAAHKRCGRGAALDPPSALDASVSGSGDAFDYAPPIYTRLKVRCEGRAGIRQARISSEWNQAESWAWKIEAVRDAGMDPIVNLIYSHSPKHTDEYYAERARHLVALQPWRICL